MSGPSPAAPMIPALLVPGGEIPVGSGMITLLSLVVAVDYAKRTIPAIFPLILWGCLSLRLDVVP
jgi:hypothetical protein